MRPVVLATDGSPSAEAARDEAIELALAMRVPLRVVVAWAMPTVAAFDYAALTVTHELTEAVREHALTVAEETAARARAAGVDVSTELREGDATEQICAVAESSSARMIVVGAHGWGAVKRLLLGSVSSRLVHEAPCAVLVVRASEVERPALRVAAS